MKTVYHKIFKIDADQNDSLIEEISNNSELYKPLSVSFGQYKPESKGREIVSIRSYTPEHDQLRYPFDLSSFGKNAEWNNKSKKFPYTQQFAINLCKKLEGTGIGKVMYARMPPGETINWHTDFYPLYSSFARVHIPLISKKGGSTFYTEYGDFVMDENYVYIYDTQPAHTTKNNSDADRTHLIIDILLNRDLYFPPVKFLVEKVNNVSVEQANTVLDSAKFKEIISKLATLIFYINVHTDGTATLLWNSVGSRTKFFEYFNLQLSDNANSCLEEISWDKSYDFVRKDNLKSGNCYIMRNDFK
jgi:hypothetical protein